MARRKGNGEKAWVDAVHGASSLRHDFLGAEIRIAFLAVERGFIEHIEKSLAPSHGTLLLIIDEHPGLTQQVLSEAVGLQRSTMARTIDMLARRGLVQRVDHDGDRRSYAIRTTEKGARLVAHMKPKIRAQENLLTEKLGKRKRKMLLELLREVQDILLKQ